MRSPVMQSLTFLTVEVSMETTTLKFLPCQPASWPNTDHYFRLTFFMSRLNPANAPQNNHTAKTSTQTSKMKYEQDPRNTG